MKQCSYISNGKRCNQNVTYERDPTAETIIYNGPDPNDDRTTIQAYKNPEPTELCYYHQKLTKGILNDSRGRNPTQKGYQRFYG